jgi:hypothetical protein
MQDTSRVDVGLELAQHASSLRLIQARGMQHVESQLDLRGGTIDMLSPRAATTTELKVQFARRYGYGLSNLDISL